jgi:hypothetical protein
VKFENGDSGSRDSEPASFWERSLDEPLPREASSFATRSQAEFLLPGSYPPCRHWIYDEDRLCLSTERMIVHLFSNSAKMLRCSNDHHHDHKGKTSIPGWEFWPGGEFDGAVPPEFLPPESKSTSKRWEVSRSRDAFLSQFDRCAKCDATPFQGGSDKLEAWKWLQENDLQLFEEIRSALRSKAGFALEDWFLMLALPLRTHIVKRLDKSALNNDHSIPKKTGNALWLLLSAEERRVLQEDLVFKLCRHCNLSKSAKLESRESIEALYVKINFNDEIAAAKADEPRWNLLHSTLNRIYGEEKLS